MHSLAASGADALATTTVANRPTISWAAVVAGMFVAVAVQIGLAELCVAAGLPLVTPFATDPSPASSPALAIVAGMGCAMVALFAGGWVAGRLAHYRSPTVAALHGALVWATGSVVAVALIVSVIAPFAGDALATRGTVPARPEERIPPPSAETVKRQVQDAIARADAAPLPAGDIRLGESSRLADRSRLMDLLDTAFPLDPNQQLRGSDREDLIVLLGNQMRSSHEVAERTFDQLQLSWKQAVGRYQDASEDASARTQRAAAIATRSAGRAATVGFAFMLIGALAATVGGICGGAGHRRYGRGIGDDAKIVAHA